MSVDYAIGVRLAGGGIGSIAHRATLALEKGGLLNQVYCGSAGSHRLPAHKVRPQGVSNRVIRKLASMQKSGRLWTLDASWFDQWLNRQQLTGQLLHVWGNYGLRSLQQAKKKGVFTVVERASSHPLTQKRLLQDVYKKWGVEYSYNDTLLERGLQELAFADAILVPSDFVRQSFLDHGVSPEKVILIPFGGRY